MGTIYHNTERIQRLSEELLHNTQLIKKYQDECDFDRFVSTARKGARVTSNMFLLYRELLISLKESISSYNTYDKTTIYDSTFNLSKVVVCVLFLNKLSNIRQTIYLFMV